MRKLFFMMIIFALIIVSCSRDSDITETQNTDPKPTDPPVAVKKHISSVNIDGVLRYKINYNSNKTVSEILEFQNGSIYKRTLVDYENGLRVKDNFYNAANDQTGFVQYYYEGGTSLISKRQSYVKNAGQFVPGAYNLYTNDKNKPKNNILTISYYSTAGSFYSKKVISYTDDYGSSVSKEYNDAGALIGIETWVKDNKIAWDSYYDAFSYQHHHNNISVSDLNVNTNQSTGYTAAFVYDNEGYPLSAKYTYSDGSVINYTFQWD